MKLLIYFDGSCWPNPGGKAKYGWRVLLEPQGDDPPQLIGSGTGVVGDVAIGTNNVAEYGGLRGALEWAARLNPDGYDDVIVRGDSQLVINCVQKRDAHRHKDHLRRLHRHCREALGLFSKPVSFEWVGRGSNSEADALSRA